MATNACTNKVLHLNYNGRTRRHAQGHDHSQSSMAVAICLLSRSSAPKGGMVGKNNLSGNDKKLLFGMESELAEELFPKTFRGGTQSLSPVRVHRKWGVVTCGNAPRLKLCVRQRKRSFSLGGVCDPVSIFPSRGFSIEWEIRV